MRRTAIVALLVVVAACNSLGVAPTTRPTQSAAAISPTSLPTIATPAVRYVNDVLGYAVELPPPSKQTTSRI